MRPTTSPVVAELDTINICVPTPLRKTKDPDMSYIVSAVERIAAHLHPGMLIILESTTYPGTTEELVQPMLEAGGLKAGVDFFLAFSPERVDPGNPTFNTHNVPKVVGGVGPESTELASMLYGAAIETIVPVSSPQAAEMVKLLENTFRMVNIGLVNEIALMCDRLGIDVWEVVKAAATKPFGFMPFYPGPGLGGHCIPIDPFYLSWKAKQTGFDPRFIELAGQINGGMPHFVVDKITDALNRHEKSVNGSTILVLGLAYKRDIDDMRESPSLDVMALLHQRGAKVRYADPYVPTLAARAWHGGFDMQTEPLTRGGDRRRRLRRHPDRTPHRRLRHGPALGAAHRRHAECDRRQAPARVQARRAGAGDDARDAGRARESRGVAARWPCSSGSPWRGVAYVYVGYPALLLVWAR